LTDSQRSHWSQTIKEFLALGMLLFLLAWIVGLALATMELGSDTSGAPRWIREVGGYGFAICFVAEALFYLAELAVKVITARSGTDQRSS
jgi:hypothetical protein